MSDTIIVSLISLVGTFGGVLTANSLSNYRIKKLEEKVDKHNSMIERMYRAEGNITELQHDVRDLKKDIEK